MQRFIFMKESEKERDKLIDLYARGLIEHHPDQCLCEKPEKSFFNNYSCRRCGKTIPKEQK